MDSRPGCWSSLPEVDGGPELCPWLVGGLSTRAGRTTVIGTLLQAVLTMTTAQGNLYTCLYPR